MYWRAKSTIENNYNNIHKLHCCIVLQNNYEYKNNQSIHYNVYKFYATSYRYKRAI